MRKTATLELSKKNLVAVHSQDFHGAAPLGVYLNTLGVFLTPHKLGVISPV